MALDENTQIQTGIEKIRELIEGGAGNRIKLSEAVSLARSIVYDIRGDKHPLMEDLSVALKMLPMSGPSGFHAAIAACNSVVTLHDQGGLSSPRLEIAREIEGDILDIAHEQIKASERNPDATHKQLQLGIAAFLGGAALEDALRRLCDANGISYNRQRTSISTLQAALYQPSKQIEVISVSDNKQITAWGDTRNKADHGRFSEIAYSEVLPMVIGVRGFIDKHLP